MAEPSAPVAWSMELSVYAVFPQRRYLAPKVKVFIDAMLARMTPEPVWDKS